MKQATFKKVGECLYRNESSGSYYALLKIRGKQKKQSLRTDNHPEARRRLAQYRRDMGRVDPTAGKITVKALCDLYEKNIKGQAARTVRRKTDILAKIRERWGETDAARVKKSDVQAWLSSFPFGEASYNLYLECIRAVFAVAIDDRILPYSPVDGIEARTRKKPIRHTPTKEEFSAIVESIRKQPFADTAKESADFVEFMGLQGLGQAETSALTWGDVDFPKGQIKTYRHKTKTAFYQPIFPQTLPMLERLRDEAIKENRHTPKAAVFIVGDPKKAIASACKRLGLQHYSARSFRRMFITDAIEKGIDVKIIAEFQGHQDGGVLILNTYSHVQSGRSMEAAKLLVG